VTLLIGGVLASHAESVVTACGLLRYRSLMDDAELLAASARGDADAFAMFYRRICGLSLGFVALGPGVLILRLT